MRGARREWLSFPLRRESRREPVRAQHTGQRCGERRPADPRDGSAATTVGAMIASANAILGASSSVADRRDDDHAPRTEEAMNDGRRDVADAADQPPNRDGPILPGVVHPGSYRGRPPVRPVVIGRREYEDAGDGQQHADQDDNTAAHDDLQEPRIHRRLIGDPRLPGSTGRADRRVSPHPGRAYSARYADNERFAHRSDSIVTLPAHRRGRRRTGATSSVKFDSNGCRRHL